VFGYGIAKAIYQKIAETVNVKNGWPRVQFEIPL
jgi:hypothetical protein